MQQNEQEQQEHTHLQKAVEQKQQGDRPDQQQDLTSAAQQLAEEQLPVDLGAQQLANEQQKSETYLDLLRRTQADFVNYRRRVSQEQAEGRIAAQSALLAQMLPVLDDLQRALRAAPAELSAHPWVQGMLLVERRLNTQLGQLGVRRVGEPGEMFDPRWHEAVTTETHADVPEGTIVHVTQPGYAVGERLVRPAQVCVAGPPSPSYEASAQQEHSEV